MDYDIVIFVESWLIPEISDAEVFNPDLYKIFRKDRDFIKTGLSRGGGVLIAVRSSLSANVVALPHGDSLLDQICVDVYSSATEILRLCVSYIPPNSSSNLYTLHLYNILHISRSNSDDFQLCILGDFNLSTVNWSFLHNNLYLTPCNISSPIEIKFIDDLLGIGLVQINTIYNKLLKILDLIFVNNNVNFNLCESMFPFSPPSLHHVPLVLTVEFLSFQTPLSTNIRKFNLSFGNFDCLNVAVMSVNWKSLFGSCDIDDCFVIFLSNFLDLCESYIPRTKQSKSKHPWHTRELRKLKNLRNKFHNYFKGSNNREHWDKFQLYNSQFNTLDKALYKRYIFNVEKSLKVNPKFFWRFVKSKRLTSSVPSSMFYNDLISSSQNETANLFAEFFKSNFVAECNITNTSFLDSISSVVDFGSLTLNHTDIVNAINRLNNARSSDMDGLSPYLIKMCVNSVVEPLCLLFNLSLASGRFIDKWKFAYISPIFKKGNKSDIANYRPISKLSTISKLFESIIKEKLTFIVKNVICENQHGFVRGRSTITNLSIFTHYCISSFQSGAQVDTIYTDFSKAFDKVSHFVLISKLSKLGFHSSFLAWIESYLKNRKCQVSIDGVFSYPFYATSGVPQGSILGPLFFILFINDISFCFSKVSFLLFADDLKIYYNICKPSDALILQSELNNLSTWCDVNLLALNVNKCFSVSYSKSRSVIPSSYSIRSSKLSSVSNILDLGVMFDSRLTFVNHLDYIIPKAYSALAFLRRNSSEFSDPHTLKILYTAFVRSKLEYAAFIWSPAYEVHSKRIERVQKVFIKYSLRSIHFSDPIPPYSSRALLLGLRTLETRRALSSCMFVYDVVCGFIDSPFLLNLVSFNVPSRCLRNSYLFYIPNLRSNYSRNEPLIRSLTILNKLCLNQNIDFTVPRSTFKNNLLNLMLTA